ncbi:DUF1501 domain-containing protein [Rubellicoccus peritrichatus]|uniref:DUF1501 domain-containing protein n=1 Tax=Rubellicoccus peritrichatus TaxID=3080537 RepID=A0AAQ3LAN9_9BACT|nr:DUF1501 domain-containing protein [Puniceicoccus sp. CR14]WOO40018.1 DUF1501 domain-containing protein [Puniceicoccus sp. CR14]
MHNHSTPLPVTRREFLKASGGALGVLSFSNFAPSLLAQTALSQTPKAGKDMPILVLVQLAGGNDGLNTVIPVTDDNYYRLRPNIAIAPKDALPIGDGLGLHPSCDPMRQMLDDGKLSIIQNVGYPNPNRSHFRSTEIWETASDSDQTAHTGWIGRYFDNHCSGSAANGPLGVHISNEFPQMFSADEVHNVFGLKARGNVAKKQKDDSMMLLENLTDSPAYDENESYLQHTMMDALVTEKRVQKIIDSYRPMSQYQGNGLAQSLRRVAALIAGGMETRVYFVSQGGYDTHSNQLGNHARLMGELSGALAAFQRDLENHRLDDQVLTMTFSEFGRRPSENGSQGTDHGTAAPLFVVGSSVNESIVGQQPDLNLEKNKDLEFGTDFRQIYSTVIDKWFMANPEPVIGGQYDSMEFIS